jgi:hypothetical protein
MQSYDRGANESIPSDTLSGRRFLSLWPGFAIIGLILVLAIAVMFKSAPNEFPANEFFMIAVPP